MLNIDKEVQVCNYMFGCSSYVIHKFAHILIISHEDTVKDGLLL